MLLVAAVHTLVTDKQYIKSYLGVPFNFEDQSDHALFRHFISRIQVQQICHNMSVQSGTCCNKLAQKERKVAFGVEFIFTWGHEEMSLYGVMADSSQTRILGKLDGQFLHARWWLQCPILDAQTLLHFGQAKVWDEDDWDAARSICLLCFSFAALCLSASNSHLAFLTDERQLSQSEASCYHDRWLIPACTNCLFS